jgi:hypothetical protein
MGGVSEPRHPRLYRTRFSNVYQGFEQHALGDVVCPESIFAILDIVGLCHQFAPRLGEVKAGMLEETERSVAIGLLSPQLTAFFTSAAILASLAAVNSFSAKAVGHRVSSLYRVRCADMPVCYEAIEMRLAITM